MLIDTIVRKTLGLKRHYVKEVRDLKDQEPDLLKKTRYILLKNPWNLTEKQKPKLSELEKLNVRINRAYLLKEAFRQF